MSAYEASWAAKTGSFFSSAAWNRRFSRRIASPGRIRLTASSVPTPSASPVTGTFRRRSCDRRSPTGRSRNPSWTLPSGRPRWLARTTRAPSARRLVIVGRAARIRESSVTLPSASGTLKSTRTKTRLPAASKSRMVSLSIVSWARAAVRRRSGGGHRQPSGDEADQIRDSAAVAPFVVVPADDLHHRPVKDHRRFGVDDRVPGVAPEVGLDERVGAHAKDALHRTLGGGPERIVELLDRGPAADVRREVDDADRRGRDPQAEAVELALQVGDDEGKGNRGTAARRNDVLPRGAGATRILVRHVEDALVVRVAVNGVHQAAVDAEQVMDDLGGGGEAVRRAARIADDVVAGRVVAALVDAEDDRDVLTLGRGADDHLLRAGLEMGACLPCIREQAGRLEDDVDAQLTPGQRGRILLLEHLDLAPVDDQGVLGVVDGSRIGAIRRVVLEQQRIERRVDQVVDGHDFDVGRPLDQRLERLSPDPAEAVDADPYSHGSFLRQARAPIGT